MTGPVWCKGRYQVYFYMYLIKKCTPSISTWRSLLGGLKKSLAV